MTDPSCRNCAAALKTIFADLGTMPLANSYPSSADFADVEPSFPLKAYVCDSCLLVQLEEMESPAQIFSDYAYFSSWSTSWLEHCRRYVEEVVPALGLDGESHVVEVASNDGYLLSYFVERGVPVLGIEPAVNVAEEAEKKGVPTVTEFFGVALAEKLATEKRADLLIGNNVLAHVPDLHDFVEGLRILLAENGVITMEFPHLMRLVDEVQFDTIYHEHFCYFSLQVVREVFAAHHLQIYDARELPTHGGSLRIYARHEGVGPEEPGIASLLTQEEASGLTDIDTYEEFEAEVRAERDRIKSTVERILLQGKRIAGYGAPAKGNTLLNYCGIGTSHVSFTVDANPVKQGRLLPGSHIPIRPPEAIVESRPDVVWILPWNIESEIRTQLTQVESWGGRFLTRRPGAGLA